MQRSLLHRALSPRAHHETRGLKRTRTPAPATAPAPAAAQHRQCGALRVMADVPEIGAERGAEAEAEVAVAEAAVAESDGDRHGKRARSVDPHDFRQAGTGHAGWYMVHGAWCMVHGRVVGWRDTNRRTGGRTLAPSSIHSFIFIHSSIHSFVHEWAHECVARAERGGRTCVGCVHVRAFVRVCPGCGVRE